MAPHQTLLLHCEQGLGDTLQFCRLVSHAKRRVGRVVLKAPRVLQQLLKGLAGVDVLIEAGQPPPTFDFHLPLMSLPRILEITPDTVPEDVPYLAVDQHRSKKWISKFPSGNEFRIGLVWKGNPAFRADQDRSVSLLNFGSLAAINGVQLVSLQKGDVASEIASVAQRFPIIDLSSELDNDGNAFVDTAAVMQQLDLVISVDTAPVHLAGALAVPVWLLSSHVSDWRWLTDRDDSPWYPTLRIFRQDRAGEWESVFERLQAELLTRLSQG